MNVLQRADLAVRGAVVAPARQGIALQVGLRADILLERIKAVQGVVRAELLQHVAGVLVDLHRPRGKRNIIGAAVGRGDQRCNLRAGGPGSEPGELRRGKYRVVLQDALVLAQGFVAKEEKGVVPPDGAADRAAVIVALQRGLIACVGNQGKPGGGIVGAVEVVAGVESFVAEVVKGLAVELVGAGASGDGDNRAITAAILRAEGGVIDLELGGGADRRLEGDLVLANIVEIDAVDLEVYRVFAIAGRDEGVCAETAAGSGKAARGIRHDASWSEHGEIEEVAAVERQLLHRIPVDHLPDGYGRSLDLQRRRALDLYSRPGRGE